MKINPIGIQSYQQLNNRQNQVNGQAEKSQKTDDILNIRPKEITDHSEISVRAPEGTYAEFLSREEKSALDLLFSKYQDSERFGAAFNRTNSSSENKTLGKVIDVKI